MIKNKYNSYFHHITNALVHNQISFFCIITLFTTHNTYAQNQQIVTFISPRSQGFNIERILAGWEHEFHCPTKENFYSTYALAAQASSSFRTERINQCLFGQDIIHRNKNDTEWKNFIIISGSETENRIPNKNWLADYFGLPTDFKSIVNLHPRINTFLVEIETFFGLNNIAKGLYIQITLPFVYTNWDLNVKETVVQKGTNAYDPGYFNATGIDNQDLVSCFSKFISGTQVPLSNDLLFHKLHYAKMSSHSNRIARFAELRTSIGYDHFIKEQHHIGGALYIAAPCGNRPKAEFLFEPMVGNGGHWELGAEITAHCLTWENTNTQEKTELFFDMIITHFFTARQKRSFDLKGKPNSRYMLMEKLTPLISDNLTGNTTTPIGQFDNEVSSVVNLSTFDIDVNIHAQADIAFMYAYTKQCNTWSFGYSIWKRSCENICIRNKECFPENRWSVKGDAHLFGFIAQQNNSNDLPIGTPIALSATQSNASINTGKNLPSQGVSANAQEREAQLIAAAKNPHIDLPQLSFAGNNQPLATSTDNTAIPFNQINTSIQPRFISLSDIDINSAQTSGFSQKIFTHFNHIIRNNTQTHSYIGIGAEIEFGRHAGPTPVIGADKCINCALSYWTTWVKGGISF